MSRPKKQLGAEPKANGQPPINMRWEDVGGPKKDSRIERAQRLPDNVAAELRPALGGDDAGLDEYYRSTRKHWKPDFYDRVEPEHIPRRRTKVESTGQIRELVRTNVGRLPPRCAAAAGVIKHGWPKPTRTLPESARDLLREYVGRQSLEHALSLGLTARAAGDMAMGLKKSRASELVEEMEGLAAEAREYAPGASASTFWIRREAVQLLADGSLPPGWDTKADCEATGFWRAVLGRDGWLALDRWVYRVGYRCRMDALDYRKATENLDWHVKQPLDYFVQTEFIQELFPP